MPLVFEWDSRKAKSNQRKHGVSFDEAGTVFDDSAAVIFPDEDIPMVRNAKLSGLFNSPPAIVGEFHGTLRRSSSNHQRSHSDTQRTERL
jgi:uncharacterized DUF497 family protein